MTRIGVPRGLLFYQYFPMWRTFFEALGAEVVVSPPTTRTLAAAGASRVVAETCMPVKVFCGHVLALKGQCDYVFVPAIRSMMPRVFNCSKFLGLPDIVRAACPDGPPVLEVGIDVNQGRRELYQAIYRLARPFTWNPVRVKEATVRALEAHRAYVEQMSQQHQTPPQALAPLLSATPGQEPPASLAERPSSGKSRLSLALVGHPYVVYDDFMTHRLIPRLQDMGVDVLTPEMVPEAALDAAITKLDGRSYWTYEGEVVGAGGYYVDAGADGVVGVLAFGCGPDSLMMDLVKRYAREKGRPFLGLTLDEHTGEAGLLTRLEAFVDMMGRRKRAG
ncbi:MAG: acyl-CoA dehydratase activase-related protein [Chloroflexota bacterium]